MKKTRILIADDHSIVRIGLAALFKTESDLAVVGEAENGDEAIAAVRELRPDVLLLDLKMPAKDGVETTRALRRTGSQVRILILSSFADAAEIGDALRAGADGVLLKTAPEGDIVEGIRRVLRGERVMSREIARPSADAAPRVLLTPRQREILSAVVEGFTNRQIGQKIGIREDSVGEHLTAIYGKLGAVNRAEAIAIAIRRQLLKI